MQKFRIFHLAYDKGYMNFNVGIIFGTFPKKNVNKVLLLIRQNNRESGRQQLLDDLCFEYKVRQGILTELGKMENRCRELLDGFHLEGINFDLRRPEKALKKQKERIKEWVELLEKKRWD